MNEPIRDDSKRYSWQMFDRIAKTYDNVNQLISFGLDKGWRHKVNRLLPQKTNLHLLDLATGTGEQVIMLCQHNDNISKSVGMDLSKGMLEIGKVKVSDAKLNNKIELTEGDAGNIPSENDLFDAVTISFGIRNVPDVPKALKEMNRVLSLNGKVLVLEFSMPRNPIVRWGHLFYLRYVLPLVGGLVSGDYQAYRYLNTSIEAFPYGSSFCNLLEEAGFTSVQAHPVSFGIATIYEGTKG